jgi:ribosomal-protein-alanine N-acetyltransferase
MNGSTRAAKKTVTMTTLRFLTIHPSMAPALAELETLCFDQPWSVRQVRGELDRPWCIGYAATDAPTRLSGYALGRLVADEMEVLRLAVHPAARRGGVGRALLTRTLAEAARRGARSAYLDVGQNNHPAVALYHSIGFVDHSRRRRYYETASVDAVVMALDLTARGAPHNDR